MEKDMDNLKINIDLEYLRKITNIFKNIKKELMLDQKLLKLD